MRWTLGISAVFSAGCWLGTAAAAGPVPTGGSVIGLGANRLAFGEFNSAVTYNYRTVSTLPVSALAIEFQYCVQLDTSGGVWTLGNDSNGSETGLLGNGTAGNASTPQRVLEDVEAISTSPAHTLCIKTDGTLWGFGSNLSNQLLPSGVDVQSPTPIAAGVTGCAAGPGFSYWILQDGTLMGVGKGLPGDAEASTRTTPVPILTDVAEVCAGSRHAVALRHDGTVWAWGSNTYGQLGTGDTTQRLAPVQIAADVVSIGAGDSTTFLVDSTGALWGMGLNTSSQLGDGTTTNRSSPTWIASSVTAVAGAPYHTLFRKLNGSLWGMGSAGASLAQTSTTAPRPVLVAPRVGAFAAANGSTLLSQPSGESPSAALFLETAAGVPLPSGSSISFPAATSRDALLQSVVAWNRGTAPLRIEGGWISGPGSQIFGLKGFPAEIAPLSSATLGLIYEPRAVGSQVEVLEIGSNDPAQPYQLNVSGSATFATTQGRFQLPDGTPLGEDAVINLPPCRVGDPPVVRTIEFASVDGSLPTSPRPGSVGPDASDFVVASSSSGTSQIITVTYTPRRVGTCEATVIFYPLYQSVANQRITFRCEVGAPVPGTSWTLGASAASFSLPSLTTAGGDILSIALGSNHRLALKADGQVLAYGTNDVGQLGDGTTTNRTSWVPVVAGARAIAASSSSSLVLRQDGAVLGFGSNANGRLGGDSAPLFTAPTVVFSDARSISVGGSHSLFVKNDGTLWATGLNASGQFGNGSTASSSTPILVGSDVLAACAGGSHSLLLKTDGTVWATGSNSSGQLGTGDTTNRYSWTQVATGCVSLHASALNSLWISNSGVLSGAGASSQGELARISATPISTPVAIASDVRRALIAGNTLYFVDTRGTLRGCGSSSSGQLRIGTTSLATPVPLLNSVRAFDATSTFVQVAVDTPQTPGFSVIDTSTLTDGSTLSFTPASIGSSTTKSVTVMNLGCTWSSPELAIVGPAAADYSLDISITKDSLPQVIRFRPQAAGTRNAILLIQPGGPGGAPYSINLTGQGVAARAEATPPTASDATEALQPMAEGVALVADLQDGTRISSGGTAGPFAVSVGTPFGLQFTLVNAGSQATGPLAVSIGGPNASDIGVVTAPSAALAAGASSTCVLRVRAGNAGPREALLTVTEGTSIALTLTLRFEATAHADGLYGIGASNYLMVQNAVGTSEPLRLGAAPLSLAAASEGWAYVDTEHRLWCLGRPHPFYGSPQSVASPFLVDTRVTSVSHGVGHAVYVDAAGTLRGYGENWYGELGWPIRWVSANWTTAVASDVIQASATFQNTWFVKSDGALYGMGANSAWGSPSGTTTGKAGHRFITYDVKECSLGWSHGLLIRRDGSAWAIGDNTYGQLGCGGYSLGISAPVFVGNGYRKVWAGNGASLFLDTAGNLYGAGRCPGRPMSTRGADKFFIAGNVRSAAVSSHQNENTCVLFVRDDGSLWGLGPRNVGNLGYSQTVSNAQPVRLASDVELVASGAFFTIFTSRAGGADSDADGLPDAWELAAFGDLDSNGLADSDGDGVRDLDEQVAGTDPRSAASAPTAVLSRNEVTGSLRFSYGPRATGRAQTVRWSRDLVNWSDLATPAGPIASGDGYEITVPDLGAGPVFLRADTTLPSPSP